MAHDFAHAYHHVKTSVEGLVAADPLRVGLNRASAHFRLIQEDDFGDKTQLRSEFRALRVRLRRSQNYDHINSVKSLDNTDEFGMVLLAENLIAFLGKMERSNCKKQINDPGPNDWDEDRSLD